MAPSIYESEHADFRKSVQTFTEREVWPRAESMVAERIIPRELWLAAGEQGYLGLEVPEEYGGLDAGDYRFNAIVIQELSRVSAALGSAFSIHFDIVVPYLVKFTTEAQRQRWLPGVVAGELIGAIAMTEPSGGSDLAALRTRADRVEGGWIVNGSKTFITNGFSADLVVTAVRTTPGSRARGISLVVLEEGMNGFTRGPKLDKVGQPESDTAELFFSDVFVPDANVIGEVDRGFQHMMTLLPQERLAGAVSNLAHARQILNETITYCGDREAFGAPIGSFQHNKFLLAELVTKADVSQAFLDWCILAHSQGECSNSDAAKAKWWTAEVQNEILDHCVQLHGGYGFMNEQRVARAWKDARVTKIWAGSNEIMKEVIGRELFT